MKLERLDKTKIPDDLRDHWQALQDTAGSGHLHTDVGLKEEHQRKRLERVVELATSFNVQHKAKDSCLEIGCCEGEMTKLLAPKFQYVMAIDFVQSLLDACPEIENVEYALHDVADWDTEQRWDVVVMSEVLEHLLDPINVLRRVSARTRYVVASCPVNEELNHETAWDMSKIDDLLSGRQKVEAGEGAGHIWAMDLEGFEFMFTSAGLKLLHSEIVDPSGIIVAEGLI